MNATEINQRGPEHHRRASSDVSVNTSRLKEVIKASPEALKFINSINEESVKVFLYNDTLSVVNVETKKTVGEIVTRVKILPPDNRIEEDTVFIEQSLQYTIGGMPSTSRYRSRLSMRRLEVYAESMFHAVELPSQTGDQKDNGTVKEFMEMIRDDKHFKITRVMEMNNEKQTTLYELPVSSMEGFVSRGGRFLLRKMLARRGVPGNFTVLTLDKADRPCLCTLTSLENQTQKFGDIVLEVHGICEVTTSKEHDTLTESYYYTDEGYLTSCSKLNCPVKEVLLQLPFRQIEQGTKRHKQATAVEPLDWNQDLQLLSIFSDRKRELYADSMTYVSNNAELFHILADLMQQVLINKPNDVVAFVQRQFTTSSEVESSI